MPPNMPAVKTVGTKGAERGNLLAASDRRTGSQRGASTIQVELMLAAERGRIAHLLPVKHARMSLSPFAFYRGAVAIMATDLTLSPNSGLITQLCGDIAGRRRWMEKNGNTQFRRRDRH